MEKKKKKKLNAVTETSNVAENNVCLIGELHTKKTVEGDKSLGSG